VVDSVALCGDDITVRGLKTKEITGVTLTFVPTGHPLLPLRVGRGVNTKLAAVEALSVIAGRANQALVAAAAPHYTDVLVSQDPRDFYYASYGPRLAAQFRHVVDILTKDPTSRQAVFTVWRQADLTHDGDRPCTLSLQFLLRKGRLEMHVTMRSQDVWRGLAYDAFVFQQLQYSLLNELNRGWHEGEPYVLGKYVHHVASLHLYERDLAAASKLYITSTLWHSPPFVGIPYGVFAPDGSSPRDAALSLLRGPDHSLDNYTIFASLNPWYAEKLEAVRGSM
jgi:thymidylate synthase